MELLLLSSSSVYGTGYLDHAMEAISEILGRRKRLAFVPFALADRAAYTEKVRARLEGLTVEGIAPDAQAKGTLLNAEAFFVGGGNTFRLLDALQQLGLLEVLRERVLSGIPYIGTSAGTNIAAPTIRTTNDMPIVEPRTLGALGLVPFQINPHYLDAESASRHMGETREQRLMEYLEENTAPVIGLREGAWLRRHGGRLALGGLSGARIFRRGSPPEEVSPGASLDSLLDA
ncbi:MAG TPA: dipeptidase PepE [Vicinamibacteria bacterium]|jgi:dipeptidase E|nr:dipeptidase PepE [Vicinamibacteria bacterium]